MSTEGGADPHAFSDTWQIPSGSPKTSDPTMLHALARIVFEETGLQLTSVIMMSGAEQEHASVAHGSLGRMRMLFMVEVTELRSMHSSNSPPAKDFWYGSQGFDVDSIPVDFKFGRYRRHAWSTEEDLNELINSGLYPVEEKAQYRMILDAFVFHKQTFAHLGTFDTSQPNASSSHGLRI